MSSTEDQSAALVSRQQQKLHPSSAFQVGQAQFQAVLFSADCDRSVEMIGRIFFNLLGGAGDDPADDCCHHLTEVEDEGWVLVNLPGEKWSRNGTRPGVFGDPSS